MRQKSEIIFLLASIGLMAACGGPTSTDGSSESAAPGAVVFIISPTNGTTLSSPIEVKFGISGMEIVPAGQLLNNSGHHHLIVDMDLPDLTQPIPSDQNRLHFGKGQTETSLELPPGQHTLQLVLGDGLHIPHVPPVVSDRITITVE